MNRNTIIFGKSESGKTRHLQDVVYTHLQNNREKSCEVYVLTTMPREWEGLFSTSHVHVSEYFADYELPVVTRQSQTLYIFDDAHCVHENFCASIGDFFESVKRHNGIAYAVFQDIHENQLSIINSAETTLLIGDAVFNNHILDKVREKQIPLNGLTFKASHKKPIKNKRNSYGIA